MTRMKELYSAWGGVLADYCRRRKAHAEKRAEIEARPGFPPDISTPENHAAFTRMILDDPELRVLSDATNAAHEALGQAINALIDQPARSLKDLAMKMEVFAACHDPDDGQLADNLDCYCEPPGAWLARIKADIDAMAAEEQNAAKMEGLDNDR